MMAKGRIKVRSVAAFVQDIQALVLEDAASFFDASSSAFLFATISISFTFHSKLID